MQFGVSTGTLADAKLSSAARLRSGDAENSSTGLQTDEEQQRKYDEIISLLLAGGYFRARISTLDPFDKVAGGMAWCIRVANENVDIDLLFQEGLRMGEKVHISENIERALAKMKCPHLLQSQELYHMNCLKIFPVVQWLVKKVIEVRAETADTLRVFSESQFKKEYNLPGDEEEGGVEFLNVARDRYQPARKFRLRARGSHVGRSGFGPRAVASSRLHAADMDAHVHAVLVEYGSGHLYTMALTQVNPDKDNSDALAAKRKSVAAALGGAAASSVEEAALAQREAALAAARREEEMLRQMQELTSQDDADMADLVTQRLKRMQESNKASVDAYKAVQDEGAAMQSEAAMRLQGQYNHKRYLAQVARLTQAEEDKLAAIQPTLADLREQFETLQAEFNAISERNRFYESEIARMLALENDENREDIAMLRSLVALNESLKLQISQFKSACKDAMTEWQRLIESQKSLADQPLDDRLETISQTFQKDLAKLRTIQSHLSSKTRAIAMVRRKMDEIPSRRELQQYQKHFLELYEQMALRFTETRQYYNTFNTLQDRRDLLQRELNVLNQIQDNYSAAIKNKAAKSKFAENLAAIADQVAKSVDKAREKSKEEKDKCDTLDEQHIKLVEKERVYYSSARAFQAECARTELLQQRLSALGEEQ